MPPKRRGTQPKSQPTKPAPDPPKPPQPSKQAPSPPAPMPQPSPPLSFPVEPGAAKVRKEWSKFVDAWYEPHKKKLIDKLQKELLVKYKNLGSPKDTQKLREMELFERLDSIAQQLAQPARTEWERRLELAQLREDQWDDMSGEEQQAVMGVFVGFFSDDVEDMEQDDDISADPSSIEEDTIIEEPHYRASSHLPPIPPPPSRQAIPPTPTRANFEFVHPTSFFLDTMTPPNPTRNLPALPMDHLATLGPSNPARPAEPVSGGVGGTLGFQNWASEVGIVSQPPQSQSTKPSPSAQTLARPRATDNISRQASAASNLSSPFSKTTSPQYSPPNPTTKFSPPINPESLPLGKRYIGPIITEEEPDPMDEELLKSKMADDYQQYKISLRIQMIYQFHAEAADIEIKLFESLLTDEGTKESRTRAVLEHETSMMRLREQKEEDRKRLCAEERERRRQEMRQHLAQRRSAQNRDVEPVPKPTPVPDKPSVQHRQRKVSYQKENVPLAPPAVPPAKLEPPSVIKKSTSMLSQDESAANEALFANAMTMMAQGKGATGLTPAQASLNEALFANAAAMLAPQGPEISDRFLQPSIMKKSNSARSQEYDLPQITVSLAEAPTPEPAQAPPITKGKKGKKGTAQPAAKPVVVSVEPQMDAEPPPVSSLWDTAAGVAKSAWGAASASMSSSKPKADEDTTDQSAPVLKGNPNAKKTASAKKGKKVTIAEEPDVDADPIVSPPAKPAVTKSAWGKAKAVPPAVEDTEPAAPPVASGWGIKMPAKASSKPQLKVAISEESEEPTPVWGSKSAWGAPTAVPGPGPSASASTQAAKTAAQPTPVRPAPPVFETVRIEPEDAPPDSAVDEPGASDWFSPENMSYWANVMAGQPEEPDEAHADADAGKHVRWTPAVGDESDDEGGEDDGLAADVWMQYAISGLGEEPAPRPAVDKKKKTAGAQLDAAFTGPWPKMEWPRGQTPGSSRVF